MAPDQTDHLPTFLEAITVPGAEQQQRLKQMHEVREVETPAMTYDIVEKLRSNSMEGSLMDEAASLITALRAERDAAVAALQGIVNFQGALTKAQFREAAADALERLGIKPISMADQSPFVLRATSAESLVQSMREALEMVRRDFEFDMSGEQSAQIVAALSRSEV